MVNFKIEPMNQTKKLTFFTSKINQQEREEEEEDEENVFGNKDKSSKNIYISYKVSINNTIGISLVDCMPREIMQISLKNL